MKYRLDDSAIGVLVHSKVCTFCSRIEGQRRCRAFEDQPIPLDIWLGRNRHTEPYPGDHGLQFKERIRR